MTAVSNQGLRFIVRNMLWAYKFKYIIFICRPKTHREKNTVINFKLNMQYEHQTIFYTLVDACANVLLLCSTDWECCRKNGQQCRGYEDNPSQDWNKIRDSRTGCR